jgi:hypothetical protein
MSEGPLLSDSVYLAEIAADNAVGSTTEAAADAATKQDRDLAAFEETIH